MELNDLINRLLMKDAEQRPSINELFANPYVKAYLALQSAPVAEPKPPPEFELKKTTLRPERNCRSRHGSLMNNGSRNMVLLYGKIGYMHGFSPIKKLYI